ncbi:MAG: M23 family metallopeptidase [Sulfurimonas sp.]|nr:M23 family metallopeptidase [Sulfurimonas sp.]
MLKCFSLFFLLLSVSLAEKLPQTFEQLSSPLYTSVEPIENLCDIQNIKDVSSEYLETLGEVKQFGHLVDASKDAKNTQEYLYKLRKLQKQYEFILFNIHKNISQSIDEDNYEYFCKLTQYKFDGLLKSSALYSKSLIYYEKNKKKKEIDFFENKIKYKKIEIATTEEFFNVPTTDTFNSSVKQTNTSKKVKIQAIDKGKFIAIFVENLNPYTITLKLKDSLKNFNYESFKKDEFVLKAGIKEEYMRLYKQKGKFTFSYSFSYTWIIGSVDAVHDDTYIYRLPFAKDTSHRVTQGYNGKYTHKGHSQYAIDFGMKIGTKVFAARDGVVVKLKEDSNKGGIGREFSKYGNYVTIEHEDTTFATYYHLNKNGVIPKIGEVVKKGSFLGYSGNTGYSSGPHLHLAVFKASSATRTETIPVKFASAKGIVDTPAQGTVYTAK